MADEQTPYHEKTMKYARCGRSGLVTSRLALGTWVTFGAADDYAPAREILLRAFDLGITHFDTANGYGRPYGSAEDTLGRILREDLAAHRDELIIGTKAGFPAWPGPNGDGGGRKYMLASLDRSLRKLKLDYVDIYYTHRPDPNTPVDETMDALATAVRQGKALYVGLSQYDPAQTRDACRLLRSFGARCVAHQPDYSLLQREVEKGLLDTLQDEGVGCIAWWVLAQGLLTDKYLGGIPADSRVAKVEGKLRSEHITPQALSKVRSLNEIARRRGQSLAQMALAWVLRDGNACAALVGASRVSQVEENVAALKNLSFSPDELAQIDAVAAEPKSEKGAVTS